MGRRNLRAVTTYLTDKEYYTFEAASASLGVTLSNLIRRQFGLEPLERGAPKGNKNRTKGERRPSSKKPKEK